MNGILGTVVVALAVIGWAVAAIRWVWKKRKSGCGCGCSACGGCCGGVKYKKDP